MRFKRILALLLAAALALAVLVGCGGGQQSAAQALLKLLDGKYPNISIEIDPELEADLRQAIRKAEAENAGDDAAVIRAALETALGSTITFRYLGDGQKGDTAFDLVFYAGSDPDKAAQAAYSQWNATFSNVPADGKYDTSLAMVETNSGVWMLVKATVEKAGTVDKPDSEPVTLQGIAIAQQPDQIKYKDGEAFDPSGMKITATYSDGSKKTIDGTSADVTFSTKNITKGITSVTVFYGGKQTAVSVECITLNQITVKLDQTEYAVNEKLTSDNVTVQAVYSDNTITEIIELNKCSFKLNNDPISLPYTFLKGGNYDLTVTYDGMTSNPVKIHVTDQNGYHEEENGTYVVTGTDGLQKLFENPDIDALSATITLTTDQTVTGTFGDSSHPFTGTLQSEDPNEKVTITLSNSGLFAQVGEADKGSYSNGLVQNIIIKVSGQINGQLYNGACYVGVVAGINYGAITGCELINSSGFNQIYQRGLESVLYMYMGGIAGKNSGQISNCTSSIGITADYRSYLDFSNYICYTGGIVGYNTNGGSVSDCDSTAQTMLLFTPSKDPVWYVGVLIGYDEETKRPVN